MIPITVFHNFAIDIVYLATQWIRTTFCVICAPKGSDRAPTDAPM